MSAPTRAEPVMECGQRAFDAARLRGLHATGLLHGSSDVLDGLARAASRLVDAPVVLINLLTPEGVRLIGLCGVDDETASRRTLPLSHTLCDVVVQSEMPLVVSDLAAHPLGAHRPDMRRAGWLAYLGIPLSARAGRTLATISAYDRRARAWTAGQIAALQDLAGAAVSDIELRINRQQRRIREQRFTAFMDHSPFVAALVNRQRVLEYVNATFELHAAASAPSLVGAPLDALPFPLARLIGTHADVVLQSGATIERTEQLLAASGEVRHWQVYAFPVEGEDERRVGIVAADMTDRRNLELQLQRAQRLESIGQLAAGIAHEINTPVQYVSDNVRFLVNTFENVRWLLDPERPPCTAVHDPEAAPCALHTELATRLGATTAAFLHREVPVALTQSIEGLERIAGIVRSVKQFSHPGGGAADLADINNALSLAVTMTRNEWRYAAECELALDAQLPLVRCHAAELNQVFLNLLVNAADAMRDRRSRLGDGKMPAGVLRVATWRDGDFVVVEITDNGIGIPDAIADRVFDPFFTTKPVGSGTGQGLAIAHAVVVQKHQGTIRFRSVEGQGTTFEVRLPIAGPVA